MLLLLLLKLGGGDCLDAEQRVSTGRVRHWSKRYAVLACLQPISWCLINSSRGIGPGQHEPQGRCVSDRSSSAQVFSPPP